METLDRKQNANKSALAVRHSSDSSSNLTAAPGSLSRDSKRLDEGALLCNNASLSPLVQKVTGPRTAAGKERSKRNAVKHGIFSSAVILRNESRSDFDSRLCKLRNDLQPKGMLEDLLVEKLAMVVWRQRRLLLAEAAEIQRGANVVEWDKKERLLEEAQHASVQNSSQFNSDGLGLMSKIANPIILEKCLDLLQDLEDEIEERGFAESDDEALSELYGDANDLIKTLFDSYRKWSSHLDCSKKEREENECPSIEACEAAFLGDLKKEIKRLNQFKKVRAPIEAELTRLESLRKSVPDAPDLDNFVRYESHLERIFDRTLTQLERLQRMRLDQPVVPPIKLDISF